MRLLSLQVQDFRNLPKVQLAERFGFQLRRINKDTIELVKELTR